MKRLAIFVVVPTLLIAGVFAYQNWRGQKPARPESQSALLTEAVPATTEEPECDNYKDIQEFERPVPIIWTAKFDSCLVSCYGASFTRVPSDAKYPRFAGYYPDVSGKYDWDVASNGDRGGSQIPDKFLKDGLILKIYGNRTGIDADHPRTVFENKCVPMVEIEKIEVMESPTPPSEADLPTIKSSELPNAFDDNYDRDKYGFLHGSIAGENGKYTEVLVEDSPIEELVSISYSNERHQLNLKSDVEINELVVSRAKENRFIDDGIAMQSWREQIKGQLSQYGEIARQYLPYDAIVNYYAIDIDNDSVKEKLITICGISANHCSDYAEIIEGNEVIFSTELYANSRGISPAKDGFYVSWTDENDFYDKNGEWRGLCCELNYHKTQFLFKNGGFVPVKQWKVPLVWKKVVEGQK
jgi:hypothetical protein